MREYSTIYGYRSNHAVYRQKKKKDDVLRTLRHFLRFSKWVTKVNLRNELRHRLGRRSLYCKYVRINLFTLIQKLDSTIFPRILYYIT